MDRVGILGPSPGEGVNHWTVMGDLRRPTPEGRDWTEDDTNQYAGTLAEELFDTEDDSELSSVFVYAETEEEARRVAAFLNDESQAHRYLHSWE